MTVQLYPGDSAEQFGAVSLFVCVIEFVAKRTSGDIGFRTTRHLVDIWSISNVFFVGWNKGQQCKKV
jgi:hypothetical protein